MPIEFRCNSCSKLLRTPDESAGKKAKCPQCGAIVDVPDGLAGVVDGGSGMPQEAGSNPFSEGAAAMGAVNPYASPQSDTFVEQTARTKGQIQHVSITFDDALKKSWSIFADQLGPCALVGLVFIAISGGISIAIGAPRIIAQFMEEPGLVVAAVIFEQIVGFFVNTFFALGLVIFALQVVRHGNAQLDRLFKAGPHYGRGLLLALTMQLAIGGIVLLLMLPGLLTMLVTQDPQVGVPFLVVGACIAIPIAMYLTFCFYLGNFFLVDRNMGPIEALKASYQFMRGNKFTVFLATIVIGFLGMLAVLCTCGVGIIAVVPYGAVFTATVYLLATGQPLYQPQPKG